MTKENKKVYILMGADEDEDSVFGVFSTLEAAKKAKDKNIKEMNYFKHWLIDDYEIDRFYTINEQYKKYINSTWGKINSR